MPDLSRDSSHAQHTELVQHTERVQKVLARAGVGSRRVCDVLVSTGRVCVNGVAAVPGQRIDPYGDRVEVDGVPISSRPGLVYILLNKPAGVVSTTADPQGRPTVSELVPGETRLFPVGRLDAATEGLIIMTNDGDLAYRLTHPSHGVEKEYLVAVGTTPSPASLRRLREGVVLDGTMTSPAKVGVLSPGTLRIIIHEGRNRQVRRMCEAIGYPVERLVRTRIGELSDPALAPGKWRYLSAEEVLGLSRAAYR